MRISTSTLNNMVTGATSGAYDKYMSLINKIIANKNFTKVSENIPDATKVIKINDQMAKLNEYQSNINAASNEINLTYDALNDITGELSSISNLVMEASNATTTGDSASAIAAEVRERVDTIMASLNTKYLDNFIFSGTNVQTAAYTKNEDGDIIYQGSSKTSGDRNLTISEGKTITYNVTADAIFGEDENGEDFFAHMKELDTLLTTEPLDYDAIRGKLDVLGAVETNITRATGAISAKAAKLSATEEINNATITNLTEKKAGIEDVDLAQVATELSSARNALQASYSISSLIMNSTSLLDYI